jgi:succinylarginine dihydrolase
LTVPEKAYEVNFDGLVGPTHNYAGLSRGNLASQRSKHVVSNPRAAALEGLAKMKLLADLGVKQAVLPPHERPDIHALRRLGFSGSDAEVLRRARESDPTLLATCCSASAMWAANAATVSPSADAADGRVHFTPANLVSQRHRSLEPQTTGRVLRAMFNDPERFVHHPPLEATAALGDEGAANHVRLAPSHGEGGIELFVYGRGADAVRAPTRFPARQTKEASQSVARLHALAAKRTVFAQQNPTAIDRGAFHNDVVSVGNENVFLYHEEAFADADELISDLLGRFTSLRAGELVPLKVPTAELPLDEAVKTYMFNSQLVTLPDGTMSLIAPAECAESDSARAVIDRLLAEGTPLRTVHYVSVRQSMSNGGGPACLRLRVVLTDSELARVMPGVLLTDELYTTLTEWVRRHYRDRLTADDLADSKLLDESRAALDELTGLLGLGAVYPFQAPADLRSRRDAPAIRPTSRSTP